MAKGEKQEDAAQNEAIQRFLGEIGGNPEDPVQVKAARRYIDQQGLIAKHGEEVGRSRQEIEHLRQQQQQLAHQMAEAKKYVDWYNQNQQGLQQYAQYVQAVQSGQLHNQQQSAQSAQDAYDLLTPQEQERLTAKIAGQLRDQLFTPYQQQMDQRLQQEAERRQQEVVKTLTAQQQAMSEVLARSLGEALPEDVMGKFKTYQERALRFADPSKLNPLDLAKETLEKDMELSKRDQEIKTLNEQLEKMRQSESDFTHSTSVSSMFEEAKGQPETRDDRYAAVMKDVTEKLGADHVHSAFPQG